MSVSMISGAGDVARAIGLVGKPGLKIEGGKSGRKWYEEGVGWVKRMFDRCREESQKLTI
jgi:hypothetical protein